MTWLRDNAATLGGWVIVVSISLGARMTTVDQTEAMAKATSTRVDKVETRVIAVESDVRLLEASVTRQEAIVNRQEQAQRELDKLVTEIRTIVEVHRDQ